MRCLLLTLFITLALSSYAQAANIYEINNVAVTVSSSDALKVRDEAMTQAEKKAFDELQKKLIAGGYITETKTISVPQISAAVESIDIVSEKIGAQDYRATYNVVFSTVDISRIFAINEVEESEDAQKFLVIPIINDGGTLKIWKNDWTKYWTTQKYDGIIFPLGDLQDLQNLKSEDIAAKKFDGIFRIQNRYGANNIALITGEYIKDKKNFSVKLEKIKDHERTAVTYEYPGGPGITVNELYEASANDLAQRILNDKLTDASFTPDQPDASTTPKVSAPQAAVPAGPKVPEPYSPMAPGTGILGEKKYPTEPLNTSLTAPAITPQTAPPISDAVAPTASPAPGPFPTKPPVGVT